MSIEVRNVVKKFGDFTALQGINLTVQGGELAALLGPSGSGKTTLLRIIAGLEAPNSGAVLFHGEDIVDRKVNERGVGFVFQHYALFRHMTVFENVAFGLRVRPKEQRPAEKQLRKKVLELLHLVRLEGMAKRFPSQLSGGQRQRVALARALAIEPRILLLDEPFGALDANVRRELRRWLRNLHDTLHVTTLFVTHDQDEALEVADRVIVLHEGKLEQIGTPEEVYHHPASPFVYHFLGNVNLFHGRLENGKAYLSAPGPGRGKSAADPGTAKIFIRPHLLDIQRTRAGDTSFSARVISLHGAGPVVKVELASEWGDQVQVEITHERSRELELKKGETVFVTPTGMKVFSDDYSI